MNSDQHEHPVPPTTAHPTTARPCAADTTVSPVARFALYDPVLRAAALAEAAAAPSPEPVLGREVLMAAGWWSAVVAPEDPRALELRHITDLPATDATRIGELFAEVVDAGGACQGDAWEVLHLWGMGSSPAAVAAENAVLTLACRAVEAELAAEAAEAGGRPAMPW